jgi:hypothetical protein
VYLCPLDTVDELPELKFGPARILKLTVAELKELVDADRLRRINADWTFDFNRFAKFTWLVVRETVRFDREPAARATPLLFERLDTDWARIEPHRQRVPTGVDNALFFISLAPWEDWVRWPEDEWRGFQVRWVHEFDDDIFVRPQPPPSPDSLSWVPDVSIEADGEEFETERPEICPLREGVRVVDWLNDERWAALTRARQTPLFETPIAHFLVRAFLAEPLDEFLAHITTIEAALGLRDDYPYPGRPRIAHPNIAATKRLKARVSALLGADAGAEYDRLFNLRCDYLHGRPMGLISGKQRLTARTLARKVVNELNAAVTGPSPLSRQDYLRGLLDRGLRLR